jgi:hypothetical protein
MAAASARWCGPKQKIQPSLNFKIERVGSRFAVQFLKLGTHNKPAWCATAASRSLDLCHRVQRISG